jgi:glycosyltransferase involved in cell wall biosynthesis
VPERLEVMFLRSTALIHDRRLQSIAATVSSLGYGVRAVGWLRDGQERVRDVAGIPTEYFTWPAPHGMGLSNLFATLLWQLFVLTHLLRNRSRYDLIHACDFQCVVPALLAGMMCRKKVIYDVFDFFADYVSPGLGSLLRLVRLLDVRCIGWADGVILPDECRRRQIAPAKPSRLAVICNSHQCGASLSAVRTSRPPGATKFRLAYVGILHEVRGINAMIEVIKSRPEWELVLAGFGPLATGVEAAARRYTNIRYEGRVTPQIGAELMLNADVMFATYDPSFPNHKYSSPNKLFEAMIFGKPLIVARCTGVDRIVKTHRLGAVIEYGDTADLQAVLERYARWSDDERFAFAAHSARIYSEHYAWPRMTARLRTLYRSVIGPPCASVPLRRNLPTHA